MTECIKQKAALRYAEVYGYSVIPCNEKKKPMIKWQQYQEKKPKSEQINQWWHRWPDANPAIVTGHISGVCVIDVDSEKGMKNLNQFISESLQMPIVETPGGGKHLWFHANGDCLRNHADIIKGCDFRGEGGYIMVPPGEAISEHGDKKIKGQYKWVVSIKDCNPPSLPDEYIAFIKRSVLYTNIYNGKNHAKPTEFFKKGRRDEDLFHAANCLVKGGASQEYTQQVIEILANSCNPPMPKKEAWEKVKSALSREGRIQGNIAGMVREFVMDTTGHFMDTDFHKWTHLTHPRDKKTVTETLRRLVKQGIIEKVGDRNGCFRKVESECNKINWQNASTETFHIILPLFLNNLVQIMPKNIVVVSGAPDSGKTAFLLNVAEHNITQHQGNIFYFSSEMGASELKRRLDGFDNRFKSWDAVEFWERADNFHDVIKPNGINIVDYLEITNEFWRVAEKLKEIHEKLKDGVCFIGLQKNPGADAGRGGTFGLEKPRLYLAMDKKYPENVIKIVKAKNWAHDVNPNGMVKHFKIIKGCRLQETSEWIRENK